MGDVQTRAGKFGELNVARDTNRFGRGRHATQTEASGRDAFAHYSTCSERNVFGMFDDRKIERAAVIHDLARKACSGDGLAVIGDGTVALPGWHGTFIHARIAGLVQYLSDRDTPMPLALGQKLLRILDLLVGDAAVACHFSSDIAEDRNSRSLRSDI